MHGSVVSCAVNVVEGSYQVEVFGGSAGNSWPSAGTSSASAENYGKSAGNSGVVSEFWYSVGNSGTVSEILVHQ